MLTRPFVTAAFAVAAACGMPSASAEEIAIPGVAGLAATPPEMSVRLTHTTTSQEVCGQGRLRSTGPTTSPTWSMVTIGMRSNGHAILDIQTFSGTSFAYCYRVDKEGAPTGDFTTVVSYAGVGDDYASALVGNGLWHDGQDNEWEMSQ